MSNVDPITKQPLRLFDPHRTDFTCNIETEKVPTVDAEAEVWLQEALDLEDPNIFPEDRDYQRILRLTRQAAERQHWKAMLNLASLYLEGRDSSKTSADAVALVMDAMRLGIPAAYDRMGVFVRSGLAAGGATQSFALIQKAADLGNPQAMVFLGEKLNAVWDDPDGSFWANMPVAKKMLECAMAQGEGLAATQLYYIYKDEQRADANDRAMKVLHEGVKLGCERCANILSIEFSDPFEPHEMFVPAIDKARGERYGMLGDALGFNPRRRFPNLDRILPLPPAKLPPWDGTRDSLLEAAMPVKLAPKTPTPSAASLRTDRHKLAAEFTLIPSGETTSESSAPSPAYWQATRGTTPAGLYLEGEVFEVPRNEHAGQAQHVQKPVWERMITVQHDYRGVSPRAGQAVSRVVPHPQPLQSCTHQQACPATGIWQPWVAHDHPLSDIVNKPWRQTWLTEGAAFPRPGTDWLLQLPEADLSWHLLEQPAEQTT